MFRGVVTVVTPIVGTARVASATGKIVEALAVEIETAGPGQSAPWLRPLERAPRGCPPGNHREGERRVPGPRAAA